MNPTLQHARRRPALRRPALAAGLCAALLAGCAGLGPAQLQPGQDEAAVRAALGEPTGRYPLAGGGQRLEYARGPWGRQTWMVDLDAAGRVRTVVQVLNADNFAQIHPGMSQPEVQRLLGRPSHRQREWQQRETWSWRFEGPFCLWAQVTFDAGGTAVSGASQGPDPHCTPDI